MTDKELDVDIAMIATDESETNAIHGEESDAISDIVDFHNGKGDSVSAMSESQTGDKLFFLLNQLEEKLVHMEEVLSQIDFSEYGQCEQCHGTIEPELLIENPSIKKCKAHRAPETTDV